MGSSAPSLSDVPGWFRYLDTDKSGTICKKEIVKRVKELSLDPAELDVIIATFDLNGDGEFNQEEFAEFMAVPQLQAAIKARK